MYDFIQHHWGDLSSVAGLAVSIVGFWVTIIAVRKAKSAAQQAKLASDETRQNLLAANALVSFGLATSMMQEIQRLHRTGKWILLPDRYTELKRALISIREQHPNITDEQKSVLTGSLAHLRAMEQKVERALEKNLEPTGVANMNGVLSVEIEKITEALAPLRLEVKE